MTSGPEDVPFTKDQGAMFRPRVVLIIRILFGLLLMLIGLINVTQDGTLPGSPEAAQAFEAALLATGYILKVVGGVEMLVGILLLANRFVALALVALVPISVNFLLFKAFLDLSTLWPALLYAALNLYLLWAYKETYTLLLSAK